LVYCNANIIDLNNINKKRTYFDDGKQYRGNVYHKIMEKFVIKGKKDKNFEKN